MMEDGMKFKQTRFKQVGHMMGYAKKSPDLGCMRCGGDMRNGKCVECGWSEADI